MSVQVVRTSSAVPSNLEAEEALLTALLLDTQRIDEVITAPVSLAENHFFSEANQRLFVALRSMRDQGHPIDLITLADYLNSRQQLDGVGGYARLATLFDRVSDPGNVAKYAEIIKDKSVLRSLRSFGRSLIELSTNESADLADLLEEATRDFNAIVQTRHDAPYVHLRDLLAPILRDLAARKASDNPFTGVLTGFSRFDQMTLGLQKSDLIVLAARPSVGKTAMALNMALHVAQEKGRVAIFSLEMGAKQLAHRLVATAGRIDATRLKRGQVEYNEVATALNRLEKCDIMIFDSPGLTPLELRAKCRMLARQGTPLDMIVVDYLQLMQGPSLKRSDSRTQEISEISRALKGIARELDVPVLALSQLSRAVESRTDKRPQLSDLRESGAIEQDADIVMFLWRKEEVPDARGQAPANLDQFRDTAEVHLVVAKHRNGPTGEIQLRFEKRFTNFAEVVTGGGRDIYFEGG